MEDLLFTNDAQRESLEYIANIMLGTLPNKETEEDTKVLSLPAHFKQLHENDGTFKEGGLLIFSEVDPEESYTFTLENPLPLPLTIVFSEKEPEPGESTFSVKTLVPAEETDKQIISFASPKEARYVSFVFPKFVGDSEELMNKALSARYMLEKGNVPTTWSRAAEAPIDSQTDINFDGLRISGAFDSDVPSKYSLELQKELDDYVESVTEAYQPKEMVNHPDHYNSSPIETMEMFLLMFHDRPDMIKGALLFNIFKYRDRSEKKNGQEDINKMEWYLDKFETFFPEDAALFDMYRQMKNQ